LTLGSYLKTIKYKVDKKMQKVKIFVNEIEVNYTKEMPPNQYLTRTVSEKLSSQQEKVLRQGLWWRDWLMKTIILLPNGCF
ncbi:MAG: hypothetical protein Q9M36_07155, partial [Sulfurovum sp.]|nr:hypothetical protein [Sulfurovum sp.]